MQLFKSFHVFVQEFAHLPWRRVLRTLRDRFEEDRLGLTASSLTFTTTIALVPFLAVVLAVFSAFPMFAKFQDVLQKWLLDSLVPDSIARQVLGYLTQFANKASKLGAVGVVFLLSTAVALFFTIDRTLNGIWRVSEPRPFAQRVFIYWAAVTLGPLALGASLSVTSYAVSASRGVVAALPGGVALVLDALQFLLVASGMALMFRYVPNTFVRWRHAWVGGLFVSAGMELAKKALVLYLVKVPTYSVVYGAFATVPILLVWIYISWSIVLLGAALTAHLPSLLQGQSLCRPEAAGWSFALALEVLQQLHQARSEARKGRSTSQLCTSLRVDAQLLESVLGVLLSLDWVGQLQERAQDGDGARYVLLASPPDTPLAPLLERLLLAHSEALGKMWEKSQWPTMTLGDVL